MISGCLVLESLLLWEVRAVGECRRLRISSQSIRSIGFRDDRLLGKEELVIEDAPRVERLLILYPGTGETARIIRAPKLEILGPLPSGISKVEIGTDLVIQGMIPVSSMSKIRTVKVLALTSSWQRPEYLDAVLDVLRCFPCLEKLYVIARRWIRQTSVGTIH